MWSNNSNEIPLKSFQIPLKYPYSYKNMLKQDFVLQTKETSDDNCAICMESLQNISTNTINNEDNNNSGSGGGSNKTDHVVFLKSCCHKFHLGCIKSLYLSGNRDGQLKCPCCRAVYNIQYGTSPPGEMIVKHTFNAIQISFCIDHPDDGVQTTFTRLPDNPMGHRVTNLLIKAWQRQLIISLNQDTLTSDGRGYMTESFMKQRVLPELATLGVVENKLNEDDWDDDEDDEPVISDDGNYDDDGDDDDDHIFDAFLEDDELEDDDYNVEDVEIELFHNYVDNDYDDDDYDRYNINDNNNDTTNHNLKTDDIVITIDGIQYFPDNEQYFITVVANKSDDDDDDDDNSNSDNGETGDNFNGDNSNGDDDDSDEVNINGINYPLSSVEGTNLKHVMQYIGSMYVAYFEVESADMDEETSHAVSTLMNQVVRRFSTRR